MYQRGDRKERLFIIWMHSLQYDDMTTTVSNWLMWPLSLISRSSLYYYFNNWYSLRLCNGCCRCCCCFSLHHQPSSHTSWRLDGAASCGDWVARSVTSSLRLQWLNGLPVGRTVGRTHFIALALISTKIRDNELAAPPRRQVALSPRCTTDRVLRRASLIVCMCVCVLQATVRQPDQDAARGCIWRSAGARPTVSALCAYYILSVGRALGLSLSLRTSTQLSH